VRDVHIINQTSYGIGVSQPGDQANIYSAFATIENVLIENVGNDGIDAKNSIGLNQAITYNNIVVAGIDAYGLGDQTGFDMRGGITATNLYAFCYTSTNCGIRFREGELDQANSLNTDFNGLGGHYGSCVGFWVDPMKPGPFGLVTPDPTPRSDQCLGMDVEARFCSASHGRIFNAGSGLYIGERDFSGFALKVVDSQFYGVRVTQAGEPNQFDGYQQFGNGTRLVACSVEGTVAGDNISLSQADAYLDNVHSTGASGYGLKILSTATRSKAVNCNLQGNTAGTYLDQGAGSVITLAGV
jgi:hypothetical protein